MTAGRPISRIGQQRVPERAVHHNEGERDVRPTGDQFKISGVSVGIGQGDAGRTVRIQPDREEAPMGGDDDNTC